MRFFYLFSVLFLASCGGGGGGGGSAPPLPSVNISSSIGSILVNNSVTLTWSSTNSSSCSASWTSSTATSGSAEVNVTSPGNNTYSISCSGEGGSQSASVIVEGYRNTNGVVVDGYISGADVFIDENDNWIADSNENRTTSDNDGKFTIRYSNGSLVSIGGTDKDSQTLLDNFLVTHKLSGHTDFKAVTPVTSVAAFMENSNNINSILGIDSSIDIEIVDPVANKGDGGVYDYLYEKGNQLTVLAYVLQNIANDSNSTTESTQDYFKAISEELEKEYAETSKKVDIETEAFILKVFDNVSALKSLDIAENNKSNTITSIAGVLPIIQVKSDASLTLEIIEFGISTFQTDVTSIANGSADEELVASYTTNIINYIANKQNVTAADLVPDINSINDNISTDEDNSIEFNTLQNDSYVTSAPYSISFTETSNGTLNLSGNTFNYSPNADFNGTDSFTYTITQYEKTDTANVSITINPVNDDPVINTTSTLRAEENQTSVATISVSDVDTEDTLTLTLGGTDEASFDLSNENVLTFKTAPDYETKTSYALTLSLTDGSATVTKDITIEIINLNDVAPEFTSETTFTADENQTAIGKVAATDIEGDDVTFSVSGTEISVTSDGTLTFNNAPDYETKTSYTITVTASDGVNTTDQSITININNLNDNNPAFTSPSILSGDENQTGIDTVTASDADGDSVTFTISGSDLAITSDGILTFVTQPDYESVTSFTAVITASDGELTTDQNVTINVNNLNDNAPVYTAATSLNASENQTSAFTVTATDADGDALTYAISGGADKDSFSINSTSGVVVFNTAPDYETKTSYVIVVDVLDGGFTTSQEVSINIIDVNEAPVFSSSNSLSADENQTSVATLSASDPEGTTITYGISGTDVSSLSLSSDGVLTFNSAPNFESKNTYSITASAGDGVNTTTQDITINVNDVNDVPVASAATYSLDLLPQDQNRKTLTLAATDEDGDTLTYSIVSNGSYGTASFSGRNTAENINVSVAANNSGSGNVFVIDGTQKKAISLNVGTTYTISYPGAHPFRFSTTSDGTHGGGTEYTSGVTTTSDTTIIEVTSSTPATLYYYCSVHSGMGSSASVSDSNGDASITYQTVASTQSAQSESFTFKVNDGTIDSDNATITIDLKTDPLYKYQWHLNNTGQTNFATNAGTVGQDLNVDGVIVDGYKGSGIVVAVPDSGLELTHEDLADNIISGSYDFVNSDNDPEPAKNNGDHGTSVAGIIAAKGWNNKGGRGVAPDASLIGYNVIGTGASYNFGQIWGTSPPVSVNVDIYNNSFGVGYGTDRTTYDVETYLQGTTLDVLENGVTNLRGGKGALYVYSAGNAFKTNATSDCGTNLTCTEGIIDNRKNQIYTIPVAALNADGTKTSYSTTGANIWISGFGGEYGWNNAIFNSQGYGNQSSTSTSPGIMTTDQSTCSKGYVSSNGGTGGVDGLEPNEFNQFDGGYSENSSCNYTSNFNGTSAAAPTVSGVIALMLEANPDLTWRDVKHILATTADKVDSSRSFDQQGVTQYSWLQNNAGYEHHKWYGFGKINAYEAINNAKTYTANSRGTLSTVNGQGVPNSAIANDGSTTQNTIAITKASGSNNFVEYVKVHILFNHNVPRSLGIRLQSPDGTVIPILQPYTNISSDSSGVQFDIGIAGFYGESIEGNWTIALNDYINDGVSGTFVGWNIYVSGN